MPPKKSTKASETKKAAEPKTKKTTKTTKSVSKTKTSPKTKKTATKKKSPEEETVSTNQLEETQESESLNAEHVEERENVDESANDLVIDQQETEETRNLHTNNQELELDQNKDSEQNHDVTKQDSKVEESKNDENKVEPNEEVKTDDKDVVDDEKINAHRIFITRIAFEATKDDLEEYFKKVFETSPHIIMGREVIVDRATGTKYHSSTPSSGTVQHKRPYYPYRRFRDGFQDHRFKRHHDSYPDFQNKFPRRDRHSEREPYNPSMPPYRQSVPTSVPFDPNKPVSYVFSGTRTDNTNHNQFNRTYSDSSKIIRERNAPKLFVGRIGFETTVQNLKSYFSQFGEVVDVYIPKGTSQNFPLSLDSQTQKGKGFGFLTFANKSSIHTVLDPNVKHVLHGREIIVDYADVHTRRV